MKISYKAHGLPVRLRHTDRYGLISYTEVRPHKTHEVWVVWPPSSYTDKISGHKYKAKTWSASKHPSSDLLLVSRSRSRFIERS